MADKLTFEEVRERFVEKGLELLEHEYVNTKTRMLCRTKEGYLKKITVDNLHRYKEHMIADARNPYALYNIKLLCQKINPEIELLTERFTGTRQDLEFRCRKCGTLFTKKFHTITGKNKINCPICWECPHKLPYEDVVSRFAKYGYTVISKEYKSNDFPVICKDKEGYYYQILIGNLGKKERHQRFSVSSNEEFYVYNIQHFCDLNNMPVTILKWTGEFLYKVPILEVQCECGEIYNTTYNRLKLGNCWCSKCSSKKSSYERSTEIWLQNHNIDYDYQYKIDECRDQKPLPFDFHIKNTNILIEVDGDYHFIPSYFGRKYRVGNLEYIQRHDKIKTDFCKENGWHLVRISYLEYKSGNYVNILEKELNSQNTL